MRQSNRRTFIAQALGLIGATQLPKTEKKKVEAKAIEIKTTVGVIPRCPTGISCCWNVVTQGIYMGQHLHMYDDDYDE